MPLLKNQIIPLTIESISNDGSGVGRHEGQAVFVPHAAVGDQASVRIVKAAKNYAFGKIETIALAGNGRQLSDCPVSEICGGCSFRHLRYASELEAKHSFVQDALERIGKITHPVLPVLPSPEVNRYRNKVQYPIASNGVNELVYGFYAARSHRIVPFKKCLLQSDLMNQLANRCVQLLTKAGATAYNEATKSGLLRHLYLRSGGNSNEIMVCFVATKNSLPQKEQIISALLEEFPQISSIVLNINADITNVVCGKQNIVLYGNETIEDTLLGVPLRLAPQSFSQVNTRGAEKLFSLAKEFAGANQSGILLDLYCGAGIIGLSMADNFNQIIGVDVVPQAIASAKKSAELMNITHARFLCKDAGEAATQLAKEGIRPDVLTVDPPRKGCDSKALDAIIALQPNRIVMISCNPATLARDLSFLCNNGYAVTIVQPVDMFPRTKHVETCVLLSHKNS